MKKKIKRIEATMEDWKQLEQAAWVNVCRNDNNKNLVDYNHWNGKVRGLERALEILKEG